MDTTSMLYALIGGSLIGIAAGALLVVNGRIAGISGVLGGLLVPTRGEVGWRAAFVAGLIAGGVGLAVFYPSAFPAAIDGSTPRLIIAGLLVGAGTRLGGGCTSGHGVCGIGRLSPRSVVATLIFIATGAITVVVSTRILGA
jgi:uncharacterized membrane protein YedE/YeeE